MGLAFFNLFNLYFRKGPPDAVIITFSTLWIDSFRNKDQIEKCSESTGINLVLFFINFFSIRCQAHIIDSLFAIAIFFVESMQSIVESKPAKPVIAHII